MKQYKKYLIWFFFQECYFAFLSFPCVSRCVVLLLQTVIWGFGWMRAFGDESLTTRVLCLECRPSWLEAFCSICCVPLGLVVPLVMSWPCLFFLCILFSFCVCHFLSTLSVFTGYSFFSYPCALCVFTFCFRRGLSPFIPSCLHWVSTSRLADITYFVSCLFVVWSCTFTLGATLPLAWSGMGTIVDVAVCLVAAVSGALVYCPWFVFSSHPGRLYHLY